MDRGDRGHAESRDELGEALLDIQTNGGNILVTGELSQQATVTVSQHVSGTTDASRKRTLAVTNSAVKCPDTYLPDGVTTDDPDVWFIDQRHAQRSVSAIPGVTDADLPAPAPNDDLTTLRRDIIEAISTFAETTADLEPGELRVVVNSLTTLLDEHGLAAVKQTLRQILPLVPAHHGIGYYFLVNESGSQDRLDDLYPLFDARLELRKQRAHSIEQRWHLPGYDQPSPWLTFTSD